MKTLFQDKTTRSLRIDPVFRSDTTQDKIVTVLKSNKPVLEEGNEEEIFDFVEFGALFGSKLFCEPFLYYKQEQENEEINENNAIWRIETEDIISSFNNNNESIDKELEYISSNFSLFYNKENFIKWCKNDKNEERVEQIINSEEFHIDKEDDLFSFIVDINKEGNRFVSLLSYVHLEYCSIENCKKTNRNDKGEGHSSIEKIP